MFFLTYKIYVLKFRTYILKFRTHILKYRTYVLKFRTQIYSQETKQIHYKQKTFINKYTHKDCCQIQFDAAVAPRVARTKCPQSEVAGHANTFIFPDINAGNIGYKIAQRLGNFEAYGPILLGLNAPVNDLSRGCNAIEVYSMAIITAALA